MRFRDKRNNKIREAFKVEKKVHIQFTENGKEYVYEEKNIEVLDEEKKVEYIENNNENLKNESRNGFQVYSMKQRCYTCGKMTEILTYIKFDDESNEDLVYPWDKKRLNKNKSSEATLNHMFNPEIEYYPIKVIGSDYLLDKIMLKAFPERICLKYSKTQKRKYPMNVCQHCGAKQGQYFIYERINKVIKEMKELPVFQIIDNVTS